MFRFLQRWRDRRAVKRWIKSAGVDPIRVLTAEDERELIQLLVCLARLEVEPNGEAPQEVVEAEQGDPPAAGSADEEELDRGGYWLKDWQDIYAEEVCQKRFGPL